MQLDLDSDGDHIDDKLEGDIDTDHDGIPNFEDTDRCDSAYAMVASPTDFISGVQ